MLDGMGFSGFRGIMIDSIDRAVCRLVSIKLDASGARETGKNGFSSLDLGCMTRVMMPAWRRSFFFSKG